MPPVSHTLTVAGAGTAVALEITGTHATEARALLEHLWTRCLVPPATPTAATVPVELNEPAGPLNALWEAASRAVTHALIAARAGKLLLFHAGALCHPESGRTVVFVAPSRTGKTTLAHTLGTRLGYLSDELVAVDSDLRVLPYAKPLSVRSTTGGPRRETSPDDLHLLPAHPHPTLARLVILNRDPNHTGAPTLEDLPLFDAITELSKQTSSLGAMDRGLHQLARLAEITGHILRITYREGHSLSPVMARLVGVGA